MQYRIVIIHAKLVVEVQQLLHHHLHPHIQSPWPFLALGLLQTSRHPSPVAAS